VIKLALAFLALLLLACLNMAAQSERKIMIIIIDGARYTETFGDPDHAHIPKMWDISQEGTVCEDFYNNGITYTKRAIPALWCGAWTEVRDTIFGTTPTSYAVLPTIFEYFRKQFSMPASECYYILQYIPDLWLPSFDPEYGTSFWPSFYSAGYGDYDVCENTKYVMEQFQPHFMWVYLADVDHAGHSGNWNYYINTIRNADSIVGELWDEIQNDPFYKDQTTLIVTNDHGRHDDAHGGFENHGCGCEGCRHIQFLATGPDIKSDKVTSIYRKIPDMAVTAAHLLGINPGKATGDVMREILNTSAVEENFTKTNILATPVCYPNPFTEILTVDYELSARSNVEIAVFDTFGKEIFFQSVLNVPAGHHKFYWNGNNQSGQGMPPSVYFLKLKSSNMSHTIKLIYAGD